MEKTRKLKCKYCDFEIRAWRTTKSGEKRSGMTRLMHHVRDNHTPTFELQRLEEENIDEDYYE